MGKVVIIQLGVTITDVTMVFYGVDCKSQASSIPTISLVCAIVIVITLILAVVAVTFKKGRLTQNQNPQPKVSGTAQNLSYGNPSFAQENARDGQASSNPETPVVFINLRDMANDSRYVRIH